MSRDSQNQDRPEEYLEPDETLHDEPVSEEMDGTNVTGDQSANADEKSVPQEIDYIDQLKRLQAEFSNYRKRVNKEKEMWSAQSVGDFIRKLLPVLADIERAMAQQSEPQTEHEKGFYLIGNKFIELLKKEGLEEIDCLNQPFDPNIHDAIQVQRIESGKDNYVLMVFDKGYRYRETIIQHAKVIVSSLESPDTDSDSTS